MVNPAATTELLGRIVARPELHARFLNTLSLMENCGARKIARAEHPIEVTAEVLKHASEEFRHAFGLKRMIPRVSRSAFADYSPASLLAATESRRYLDRLEVAVCRDLKRNRRLGGWALCEQAYLLVTWAIELRARELYPLYQAVLDAHSSPVNVRSIIAEEEGHLVEMEARLAESCGVEWRDFARVAAEAEAALYARWSRALADEIARAGAAA